jgi:Fe-S-cluster containining protein
VTNRCTGHCCREFYLPLTPAEIESYARGEYPTEDEKSDRGFMARNAIWLKTVNGSAYFTCRQYDTETGNCNAYDRRPRTCSGYPGYGGSHKCSNKGCTWTIRRATGRDLMLNRVDFTSAADSQRHWRQFKNQKTSIGISYRTAKQAVEKQAHVADTGSAIKAPQEPPCTDC